MQQDVKLKTYDGLGLYGTLDSVDSKELIIFVHGFTGGPNQHHYLNASPFFNEHGFDTFRFSFYPYKDDARTMTESTITMHVNDLKVIIEYFRDKYENIVLVGASLGAIVILQSDLTDISKVVFWDPTGSCGNPEEKKMFFLPELDKYLWKRGKEMLVSKEMVEEWQDVKVEDLAEKITLPCKFIFAGDRRKYDIWYPVIKDTEIEYAIIEDSTHDFVEAGKGKELFEETLKFLEK